MIDKKPKPQPSPPEAGNGPVFQLQLVRDNGELKFSALWGPGKPTEQQKFDIAMAVDKVMRGLSERYKDACAVLDEAARLGHKVSDYPLLEQFVSKTIFIEEADDASSLGN